MPSGKCTGSRCEWQQSVPATYQLRYIMYRVSRRQAPEKNMTEAMVCLYDRLGSPGWAVCDGEAQQGFVLSHPEECKLVLGAPVCTIHDLQCCKQRLGGHGKILIDEYLIG